MWLNMTDFLLRLRPSTELELRFPLVSSGGVVITKAVGYWNNKGVYKRPWVEGIALNNYIKMAAK